MIQLVSIVVVYVVAVIITVVVFTVVVFIVHACCFVVLPRGLFRSKLVTGDISPTNGTGPETYPDVIQASMHA